MNHHSKQPDHHDWGDRLVDQALTELAGHAPPADLAERIIAARTDHTVSLPSSGVPAMTTKPSSRFTRMRSWSLAASVLVNFGLAAALLGPGDESVEVSQLDADVHRATESELPLNVAKDSSDPGLPSPYYKSDDVQYPQFNHQYNRSAGEQTDLNLFTSQTQSMPEEAFESEEGGGERPLSRRREMTTDAYSFESLGASVPPIVPMPSTPPIAYPTERQWHAIGDRAILHRHDSFELHAAPTWGYANPNGRRWPGSADGQGRGPGTAGDQYDRIVENPFLAAAGEQAISTFSIDVDTASYANARQMLLTGHYPPADAVRLEEFVNYFNYDYEGPSSESDAPFASHVEVTACPWEPKHRLVRIGIKGREIEAAKRPQSNLVFLVDISGSMNSPEKLPLALHGLKQLATSLGENDRVAIVVYASSEGLALPSTPGTEQETILGALGRLQAGGSTAGGAGIRLAYQIAEENFIEGGTNRVILCTDGDFNVGTTSSAELERMVEEKAKTTRVFLSAIGFGRGNLNDAMMEKITGIGNGNYYYVDGEQEAERVFVKGMTGMLVTIAKDVKIQVEFNPAKVAGYRLLGYENRMLRTQDFNDDTKDAGEIGSGHTVTALYQVVPAGEKVEVPESDELKYQQLTHLTDAAETDELLTLKMRYKAPDAEESTKLEWPVKDAEKKFGEASTDTQFAAAVASFGLLLRDSQFKGDATLEAVAEIAAGALGSDADEERSEFLKVVEAAKRLRGEIDEARAEAEKASAADKADSEQPPAPGRE